MTQPFVPLETLYTRALRLLGVLSPGSRQTQLSLAVVPVSVISDVSDASIPHSNPVFGITAGSAAVAAVFSGASITPTRRLVRLRLVQTGSTAASIRLFVGANGSYSFDNVLLDTRTGSSIGPAADPGTALIQRGTGLTTPNTNFPGSWTPTELQFDLRPPLLIAPGFTLFMVSGTANDATTCQMVWEEIPEQIASADLGFPAA